MWNGFYHIIVIVVAVWGLFTGYRKGFLRQIGSVVGMAFGIVTVRMVAPDFLDYVNGWIPPNISGFRRGFLLESLTCGFIYIVVSFVIQLIMFPVGKLMSFLGGGMLNTLAGAAFKMFKFLFILSIVYNIFVDLNPQGNLTKSSRQHDGNLVEGVMKIAPPILGFPDAEEVGHMQQLEDAKKIS